jgi:hypothetical protein
VNDKEIKKSVEQNISSINVDRLVSFLAKVIDFLEENLYLDKPIEGAQPYFEILRIILEIFGDQDFKAKQS